MALATQESSQHDCEQLGFNELPPSLDRLNWGAMLLPFFWAVAHGLWSWVGLFIAMRLVYWSVGGILRRQHVEAAIPNVLVSGLVALIGWGIALFFALHANSLYWRGERKRVERRYQLSNFRWTSEIDSYAKSQRRWAVCGVAIYVLGTLLAIYYAFSGDARFPWLPAATVAVTLVDLVFLLAVFVWDRRSRASAS